MLRLFRPYAIARPARRKSRRGNAQSRWEYNTSCVEYLIIGQCISLTRTAVSLSLRSSLRPARVSPAHGHQGFRWGFQGSNGGYYWTPTLHIRGPAGYARGPIWTPGPLQGKPWTFLVCKHVRCTLPLEKLPTTHLAMSPTPPLLPLDQTNYGVPYTLLHPSSSSFSCPNFWDLDTCTHLRVLLPTVRLLNHADNPQHTHVSMC